MGLSLFQAKRLHWSERSFCDCEMANDNNLSSLVHELRERVAASSSTPANNIRHSSGDEDALEIRFRAVIPNLLNTYVVPSLGNYCFLFLFPWMILSVDFAGIGLG